MAIKGGMEPHTKTLHTKQVQYHTLKSYSTKKYWVRLKLALTILRSQKKKKENKSVDDTNTVPHLTKSQHLYW